MSFAPLALFAAGKIDTLGNAKINEYAGQEFSVERLGTGQVRIEFTYGAPSQLCVTATAYSNTDQDRICVIENPTDGTDRKRFIVKVKDPRTSTGVDAVFSFVVVARFDGPPNA